MKFQWIMLFTIMMGCVPFPPGSFIPPQTKLPTDGPNSLSEGLLTEYDIWEFLGEYPSESDVVLLLGAPDSVWASDEQPYYIMYYYRSQLQDYNSIELNTKTRKVTGYEWDE